MKYIVKIADNKPQTFETYEGATAYFIKNWEFGMTYTFTKVNTNGTQFAY